MKIQSVQEYLTLIESLRSKYTDNTLVYTENPLEAFTFEPKFIFRGHGDHKQYKLIPGIFRETKLPGGLIQLNYSCYEYDILSSFIAQAKRYVTENIKDSDIGWLEIAQHFGVPTRLLDWTENPLVALYFACCDKTETQASVWILNTTTYQYHFFDHKIYLSSQDKKEKIANIMSCEIIDVGTGFTCSSYPIIYQPTYREERMSAQSSIFMLWGKQQKALTDLFSEEYYMTTGKNILNSSEGILCAIEIPGQLKQHILAQLDALGINEKFIYPGLDGIGKYINRVYSSI